MKSYRAYDRLPKELSLPYPGNLYPELPELSLDPTHTALVIVDMQYGAAHRDFGVAKQYRDAGNFDAVRWRFERIEQVVLPNLHRFLDYFRAHRLRVIYLTIGSRVPDCSDAPYHTSHLFKWGRNWEGLPEHEILDELKPLEGEIVINKTTVGAFSSTNLDHLLRQLGIQYLIFTGVGTEGCVDTTARQAADLGYRCVVVEDCTAGMKELWHQVALIYFGRVFGKIMSSDEALEALGAAAPVGGQRR